MIIKTNGSNGGVASYLGISSINSYINVEYPEGTICTCSNGTITLTAPNTAGMVSFAIPNIGSWTIYCTNGINNASQIVSVSADNIYTVILGMTLPDFTYTGDFSVEYDNADHTDWRIKFLTSGILRFSNLGNANNGIDVFLVGGGGAGYSGLNAGGGGGGYTRTYFNIKLQTDTNYSITVGEGGQTDSANGTASSAFGYQANGGFGGSGAAGGSSGGAYQANGASDGDATNGQGITTREFGESGGILYAGGGSGNDGAGGAGGGGTANTALNDGQPNTGGGGAGGNFGKGGSGIVIIRNARYPLPTADYQQVEYIQNTGANYIDSGVHPSSNIKIDIDWMQCTINNNALEFIMAVHPDAGGWSSFQFQRPNYGNCFDVTHLNQTLATVSYSTNVKYNVFSGWHNGYSKIYIDGIDRTPSTHTAANYDFNTVSSLAYPIFAGRSSSSGIGWMSSSAVGRLYSLKIYKDKYLVRNYIPCYRKSDNKTGLYDSLNGVFYPQLGSGAFILGPNVN